MVPVDKDTNHFLVEFNGPRETDGFASQSLDACSERQVVTLDTLGEYLSGQMHLARHLSGIASPIITGDKTYPERRKQAQQAAACLIITWAKGICHDSFSLGITGIPKPMSILFIANIGQALRVRQSDIDQQSTIYTVVEHIWG